MTKPKSAKAKNKAKDKKVAEIPVKPEVETPSAPPQPKPVGFAELAFAGDLVLLKCLDPSQQKKVQRYQKFFEYCANLEKNYRLFLYRFLNALMLTSHARRIKEAPLRKHIFEIKNQIIQSLVNDLTFRPKLKYIYLKSNQFKVTEYCAKCTEENKGKKRHEWKFCKDCIVNWAFYDVICIQHFFDKGKAFIFLGDESMNLIPKKIIKAKGKLENYNEEVLFNNNIHFTPKNLNAITLKSVITFSEKLISKSNSTPSVPPPRNQSPEKRR